MGWLGDTVLFTICIYPIIFYILAWLRIIPGKVAPWLEGVPFLAFALWLLFIAYLAILTKTQTASFPLRSDFSPEASTALYNEAKSMGIPMTVVFKSRSVPTA